MRKSKRIFIVADVSGKSVKIFLNQMPKLAKGLIRLGHDARIFSYCDALRQLSPFKSKTLTSRFYKSKVDRLLANRIKDYKPDIVYVSFARVLNADTIEIMRRAAPNAFFIGEDGDPWPKLKKNRIDTAKELDILMATNDGQWLQDYRDAGVPLCVFMPNCCDPDTDYRYEVEDKWKTDILWTGTAKHNAASGDTLREDLVVELMKKPNATLYGCFDKPQIGGSEYLYAISGTRIGVNVNADNSVRLYHSDRLLHYLACGTFAMAKRFPDCDLLYKDGEHLKYFDSIEEFFELSNWYLKNEQERRRISDAGMVRAHEQFNCEKIAGYILELARTGRYSAPWYSSLSKASTAD